MTDVITNEEWLSWYKDLSQGREEKWPEEDNDLKKCCCCWSECGLTEWGGQSLFCDDCWVIRRNVPLYEKTFDKRKVVFSLLKLGLTMERTSVMSGLRDEEEVKKIVNIRMNGLVLNRKSGRCGPNIIKHHGNMEFTFIGGYF